jgi:primase-polymerase (primpol)-like protein
MTQTEIFTPQLVLTEALKELRSRKQWVCWKLENRKGKLTKSPYRVNGFQASSTDSRTWTTHEIAEKTYKNARNEEGKPTYTGTGFVFNDDYTGIDLDHCVDEYGNIAHWAEEILDQLNSYAEFSPSGTGIHILTRALLPEVEKVNKEGETIKSRPGRKVPLKDENHPKAAIEMYCQGRFFTVTGHHVSGTPATIEARQDQVNVLHQRMEQLSKRTEIDTQDTTTVRPLGPVDLSDEQLLEKAKAAKNGSIFTDLWEGRTSTYNNDHSAADQALCNLLAFWTGKDATRIDHLFRKSGLYREEKWERNARSGETYGEGTISRAIASCQEVYTGNITDVQNVHGQTKPRNKAIRNELQLPQIVIGEQLRVTRDETIQILSEAHAQRPTLFTYQSTVSKIERDEVGRPIVMQLGVAGLRNELTDIADFFQYRKAKGDEWELKDIAPPKELAEQILALAPSKWKLPTLKGVVETPVCRPDGSILDQPGYDPATKLYYVASPTMRKCRVPEHPTQADAIQAMNYIQQVYDDFIWEGQADRANATGLLFTPFIRHAVPKDIPLALIDANNPGTGKGLITGIVAGVAIGERPSVMRAEHDDTEWKKTIIAKLLQAPSLVVIDNIRGVLESASLEMMLTGDAIEGRILGYSKMAKVKNQATWMATGNNLLIGGDLPRRCYRIRLLSLTAKPEERDDFKISDLEAWVLEHRIELITAILTVIRAWYLAGKPKDSRVPKLASFTDWAQTIGGILHFSGVEGFQQNRDELRSRNNDEAIEWEAFLSSWYETFGTAWKSSEELTTAIDTRDENTPWHQPPANPLFETLPKPLKTAFTEKRKSFVVALPIQLQKRVQTVYGLAGYRIEKQQNRHKKTNEWRVVRVVAGGQTNPTQGEKNLMHASENYAGKDDELNPPQPPAERKAKVGSNGFRPSSNGHSHESDLRGVQANNEEISVGPDESEIFSTPSTLSEKIDHLLTEVERARKLSTQPALLAKNFVEAFCAQPGCHLKLENNQIKIGVPQEMSDEEFEHIYEIVEEYGREMVPFISETVQVQQ